MVILKFMVMMASVDGRGEVGGSGTGRKRNLSPRGLRRARGGDGEMKGIGKW